MARFSLSCYCFDHSVLPNWEALQMAEKKTRTAAGGRVAGSVGGPKVRGTVALRIAENMGLLSGPKSMHFNAKVQPALFQAAAKRLGTTSPAAVINAALASLATEDQLGPWLANHWGDLADAPPELLAQIDF
jgi:hypothetical protein